MPRHLTDHKKQEISKKAPGLYQEHLSLREIGRRFNVDKATVRNYLLKAGEKIRTNSEAKRRYTNEEAKIISDWDEEGLNYAEIGARMNL